MKVRALKDWGFLRKDKVYRVERQALSGYCQVEGVAFYQDNDKPQPMPVDIFDVGTFENLLQQHTLMICPEGPMGATPDFKGMLIVAGPTGVRALRGGSLLGERSYG